MNDAPKDTNERTILRGDEDETRGVAYKVKPDRIFYTSRYGVKHSCHPANWTTTHRCGEPIDEIAPMHRDADGVLIERGTRVKGFGENGTVHALTKIRVHWISDGGTSYSAHPRELRVIPPTPETITSEVTVKVKHTRDEDAVARVRERIGAADGMEVRS